mmetsp:Transcript_28782/g.73333  ORF Transcript_28782/g.73333 Transcript_28782/m.73333 type:complete len:250 (-) Transcript_28782:2574-3323(-)
MLSLLPLPMAAISSHLSANPLPPSHSCTRQCQHRSRGQATAVEGAARACRGASHQPSARCWHHPATQRSCGVRRWTTTTATWTITAACLTRARARAAPSWAPPTVPPRRAGRASAPLVPGRCLPAGARQTPMGSCTPPSAPPAWRVQRLWLGCCPPRRPTRGSSWPQRRARRARCPSSPPWCPRTAPTRPRWTWSRPPTRRCRTCPRTCRAATCRPWPRQQPTRRAHQAAAGSRTTSSPQRRRRPPART